VYSVASYDSSYEGSPILKVQVFVICCLCTTSRGYLSGRGEVASLGSLFSIHVSKLYSVTENYAKFEVFTAVGFLQAGGVTVRIIAA
jgi:hypothetical protein